MNALYSPVPEWANRLADAEGLSTTQWVRLVSAALHLIAGDRPGSSAAFVVSEGDEEHALIWPFMEFLTTKAKPSLDELAARSLGGFYYSGIEVVKALSEHPLLRDIPVQGWVGGRSLPVLGDPSRGSLIAMGRGTDQVGHKVLNRIRSAVLILSRALAGHVVTEATERAHISSRREFDRMLSRELRRAERGKSVLGISAFRLMANGQPASLADYELMNLQEGVVSALRRGGDFVGQYDRSTFTTLTTDGDSDSALGAAAKLRSILDEMLDDLNKDRPDLIWLRTVTTQASGEHRHLPGREVVSRLVAKVCQISDVAFCQLPPESLFEADAVTAPRESLEAAA